MHAGRVSGLKQHSDYACRRGPQGAGRENKETVGPRLRVVFEQHGVHGHVLMMRARPPPRSDSRRPLHSRRGGGGWLVAGVGGGAGRGGGSQSRN